MSPFEYYTLELERAGNGLLALVSSLIFSIEFSFFSFLARHLSQLPCTWASPVHLIFSLKCHRMLKCPIQMLTAYSTYVDKLMYFCNLIIVYVHAFATNACVGQKTTSGSVSPLVWVPGMALGW